MQLGAIKPLLTAMAMPPLSLLLLALLGLLLMAFRRRRTGMTLLCAALALLWLVSCHGFSVWLERSTLPQYPATSAAQLKAQNVQAIVVLGGGMLPVVPEYGQAQPVGHTLARMRYGIWLSRQTGLPLAFTGGNGWSSAGDRAESEASVTARFALQDYGVKLRWLEGQSRDTAENARLLAPMLKRDGIQRIALVTDAWHVPRALQAFERSGFTVTAAPIGQTLPAQNDLMEWLPSAAGMSSSQQILREVLGIMVARWLPV